MKQGKVTTYVLLAGVVLIWGTVVYRVVTGMDWSGGSSDNREATSLGLQQLTFKEKPVVEIQKHIRDPFLGKRVQDKKVRAVGQRATARNRLSGPSMKRTDSPTDKEIPLKYLGILNSEAKKVALINWEGKDYMVKEGEERAGIEIIEILPLQIQVKFLGEKHVIKQRDTYSAGDN